MDERGFTLVEVLTVITLIGILSALATYEFKREQLKSSIEAEVRDMYTEFVNARMQAFYTKRPRSIIVSGTQFSIYSSNVTSVNPIVQKTMKFPVVLNTADTDVTFETSGLTFGNFSSVCIEPADNPGFTDSIVISAAKVNMGKRVSGGNCGTGSIVQR